MIGIDNPNQQNVFKIQSLDNHLCAYQHLYFFFDKSINNFIKAPLSTSTVPIHSSHLNLWKNRFDMLLNLLGADSFRCKGRHPTSMTLLWHGNVVTAIMTTQLLMGLMVGKRNITLGTLGGIPTTGAF